MKPHAPTPWQRDEIVGLVVVLTVAALLCIRQMGTLLPWFLFIDETRTSEIALHLLQNRTLDPSFSYYPAVALYINALAYLAWAAVGNLTHALDALASMQPSDPALIMISRWVSLIFGLLSLFFTHLLAREYLPPRWALLTTLLFALNSINVTMGALAKIDTINLLWFVMGYWAFVRYARGGGWRWVAVTGILGGLSLVTKNNYTLVVFGLFAYLARAAEGKTRLAQIITGPLLFPIQLVRGATDRQTLKRALATADGHVWGYAISSVLAAVICSPYTFIHFQETVANVGFLHYQAATISTSHTDPHLWWLDRYHYLLLVVYPFLLGPVLALAAFAGAGRALRKQPLSGLVPFAYFIGFSYLFASQAGEPARGTTYPYYIFLPMLPLAILFAVDLSRDLVRSRRMAARVAGAALLAVMLLSSLHRVDSFHRMFFEPYDRLGPWLHEERKPGETALLVSVYLPSPALGPNIKSLWPQDVSAELIEREKPDYLIIDTWLLAGFRKIYRDLPIAPMFDSFLSGKRGYEVVKTFPAEYAGKRFFSAIDLEHDVEIIVLRKIPGGPP